MASAIGWPLRVSFFTGHLACLPIDGVDGMQLVFGRNHLTRKEEVQFLRGVYVEGLTMPDWFTKKVNSLRSELIWGRQRREEGWSYAI